MKLPSFQFYPGDWRKDPDLSRCSKAAKGVWMDMLCLMFECEERGVLASGGKPWSDRDIAVAAGGDLTENLACIQELIDKGVANRNESGAVYSRRLVRDEQIRKVRTEAGKKGGNPNLLNQNQTKEVTTGVNQNTTPSPSSSSSASTPKPKTKDSGSDKPKPATDPRIKILVDEFFQRLKVLLKEEPAQFNGGAAAKEFQRLLKSYPEEEIRRRMDNWFQSKKPFIVQSGFKVTMFFGNFNVLKDGPINSPQPGEKRTYSPDVLTIVRAWKGVEGVTPESENGWDAINLDGISRDASKLLDFFRGDKRLALLCIDWVIEWSRKSGTTYTFMTVLKHSQRFVTEVLRKGGSK